MLDFIYGTMGAGKTQDLIEMYENNLEEINGETNIKVMRFRLSDNDDNFIKSRNGKKIFCELFNHTYDFEEAMYREKWLNKYDWLMIDEIQFCTSEQIKQLQRISTYIDVLCYGLLLDNSGSLFTASEELIKSGAYLREIIGTCCFCSRPSVVSLRYQKERDKWVKDTFSYRRTPIPLNKMIRYLPVCKHCADSAKYKILSTEEMKKYLKRTKNDKSAN